jgi:hypothetical protein
VSRQPGATQTILKATSVNRFHDLTTFSYGVIADQANGGLRKDLTSAFASSSAPAFISSPIYTKPTSVTNALDGPPWSYIRDYYRLNPSGSTSVNVVAPTATTPGIHPVMSMFQIYFSVGYNATTRNPRYFIFPSIVLWNPYNTTINAADYQVVISNGRTNNETFLAQITDGAGTLAQTFPLLPGEGGAFDNTLRGVSLHNMTLNLRNGPSIPPGRSVVYSLPVDYNLPTRRDLVPDLQPGWGTVGGRPTTAFYENTNETVPPTYTIGFQQFAWGSGNYVTNPSLYMFNNWGFELKTASGQNLQGISVNAPLTFRARGYQGTGGLLPTTAPSRGWKFSLNATKTGNVFPAVRWLANYNPRASYIYRAPTDSQFPNGDSGLNYKPGSFNWLTPGTNNSFTSVAAAAVGIHLPEPVSRFSLFTRNRKHGFSSRVLKKGLFSEETRYI